MPGTRVELRTLERELEATVFELKKLKLISSVPQSFRLSDIIHFYWDATA